MSYKKHESSDSDCDAKPAETQTQRAEIIGYSDNVSLGEFVCAIGVFDGLHIGHRYIIGQAVKQARSRALRSIVLTFDHDPDEFFLDASIRRKLVSNADRIAFLARSGVDAVLVLPFNADLALLSPDDFLDEVIAKHGAPRGIHVGANFRFGAKAAGTVDHLRAWGESHDCEVHAHILRASDKLPISSTRIRDCVQSGNIEQANRLLARPHYARATVVAGRGVGHDLGVPTANLELDEMLVRPADGVYFGVFAVDGGLYKAAISVGVPSTFAGTSSTIEAHLLDFDGDLYGRRIQLFFCEFLRPMQTFESVDELVAAVDYNIEQVRGGKIPENLSAFIEI
ncbi:MAG TPA: riboflavin biosynthesis protein RibF [Coriobacteriia bacterium]|nr:riboflavin biosynthesis protein RibF [Coriobacteriia bacterium]